jgi:hypothetical protein
VAIFFFDLPVWKAYNCIAYCSFAKAKEKERKHNQKGTEDEKEFKATVARVRRVGRGGLRWLREKRPNAESWRKGG